MIIVSLSRKRCRGAVQSHRDNETSITSWIVSVINEAQMVQEKALSSRRKVVRDVVARTADLFHASGAATGNARSPKVRWDLAIYTTL